MLPVVNLSGGWETLLEGEALAGLERDVLPPFLTRQRWFAGKARELDAVRLADATVPGTLPDSAVLALIDVTFRDGGVETYLLPLGLSDAAEAEAGPALARVEGPEGTAILRDALADDALCSGLLVAIETGREITTGLGRIRATSTSAYTEARGPGSFEGKIRRGSAEQSNTNVVFGDRLILKVFRRLEPGLNPDLEIGRFLTQGGRFDRVPLTAGAIEYDRQGAEPITLAILQGLVPNQGTGWEHALEGLRRYFETVAGFPDEPDETDRRDPLELASADPPPDLAGLMGESLREADTLGRRTAELHLALASDPADPRFAPEPLTSADMEILAADVRAQVETALDLLRTRLGRLDAATAGPAREVLDRAPGLLGMLDRLADLAPGASKIRCHGDYHLGQVLWTGDDYAILDFEGEPARPLARRMEKQSPLKDVVGMIRSYDYAAFAALFAHADERPGDFDRLVPWARAWRTWAASAFLGAYLGSAGGAPFLPSDPADLAALLHVFTLDKALYELRYELNNRPDWVRIPLQGVRSLIGRTGTGAPAADRGRTP